MKLILFSTEITSHPSSTTVIALQDVTLTCSASVNDVTYSWHRVGGSVPSRSRGQNNNELTIPGATPHDEGKYYCLASKDRISVESNRATVKVDGKHTHACTHVIISWALVFCLIYTYTHLLRQSMNAYITQKNETNMNILF